MEGIRNRWHKELVRTWHEAKSFLDNWEDQLGDDFMMIMEHASFTYYNCPSGCDGTI